MRMTRREFTRLATTAIGTSLLAACGRQARRRGTPAVPTATAPAMGPATPAPAGAAPGLAAAPGTTRYRQAPMLDGPEYAALPPVDERLPNRPLELGGTGDVGVYGGALRRPILQTSFAQSGGAFRERALRRNTEEACRVVDALHAQRLFLYDQDLVMRPWLCESWEVDSEGAWSLHLRQGLRWSNGQPCTFQDVRFALDHSPLIASEEVRSLLKERYEVVDDHLLRIHTRSLNALEALNDLLDGLALLAPAEYVRTLSREFNDAAQLERRARSELHTAPSDAMPADGVLVLWWNQQLNWRLNPDLPTLNPWVLAGIPTEDTFRYRRNPYSWLVDASAQQLPYLDELTFIWTDTAGLREALRRGEPDVADQGLAAADYAGLRDLLDPAIYALHTMPSSGHLALQLNLSTSDSGRSAQVNDRRVRQAVSYLMRRGEMNSLRYEELLAPRQLAPLADGAAAAALAEAFLEHDVEAANRLLDEAGYDARDDAGYRVAPDGERLSWAVLEEVDGGGPSAQAQSLAEWLAEGGIECLPEPLARGAFAARWGLNDWTAYYARVDLPVAPSLKSFGFWAGRALLAWSGQYAASERPEAVRPAAGHFIWALWDLYEEYQTAEEEAQRAALWQRAMAIWREELPAIGVLGKMPRLVVARRTLRGLNPAELYSDELGGLGGGRLALFHYASA